MKPILINGFPRSGTTYLFRYLNWISNGKALFEPLNPGLGRNIMLSRNNYKSPYYNYWKVFGESVLEIIKQNPNIILNKAYSLFYPKSLLKEYLENLEGLYIKELRLHFYLKEKFVKEKWKIFLIVRHPADVFLSISKTFNKGKIVQTLTIPILGRVYTIWMLILLGKGLDLEHIFYNYYELRKVYFLKPAIPKPEEAFISVWTIANYYAINSINLEKQLIIYEKPETYYKLPKWEKWLKIEPLRIKKYKARKKYEKEFYEIAKKLGIEQEFKELMSFFER